MIDARKLLLRFIGEVYSPSLDKLPGLGLARDRKAARDRERAAQKLSSKPSLGNELPKSPSDPKRSLPKFPGDPDLEKRVLAPTVASSQPPVSPQSRKPPTVGLGPNVGDRSRLVPSRYPDQSASRPYTRDELRRGADVNPDRDSILKQANDARARAQQYLKMYKAAHDAGHREKATYLKKQYNSYWSIWRDLEGKLK